MIYVTITDLDPETEQLSLVRRHDHRLTKPTSHPSGLGQFFAGIRVQNFDPGVVAFCQTVEDMAKHHLAPRPAAPCADGIRGAVDVSAIRALTQRHVESAHQQESSNAPVLQLGQCFIEPDY